MAFSLSERPRCPYSASERRAFAILARSRNLSSNLLVERFYRGEDVPINGRIIVGGVMRSLVVKANLNGEPFRLVKSERRGPHPIVWGIVER